MERSIPFLFGHFQCVVNGEPPGTRGDSQQNASHCQDEKARKRRAEHHGYDWGVSHPGWRGPFLNIDWGKEVNLNVEQDSDFQMVEGFKHYYKERFDHHKRAPGCIGIPDNKFYSLPDNCYINGTFQRMSYIEDHRDKICSWLTYDDKVTDYSSDDICVIQLPGADYTTGHSMLPPQ